LPRYAVWLLTVITGDSNRGAYRLTPAEAGKRRWRRLESLFV